MKKIEQHPHYVYITIPKQRSRKDISINSRLKDELKTVHNFQHVVRIEAFTNQLTKKNIQNKNLITKKIQGTSYVSK